MYRKSLIKKIKVYLKFYDVTAWLKNNCNIHIPNISKCLILFLMFACNNFPFHAFLTMDFNRSVGKSCCSTGFSCAFSWLWTETMFFELPVLIPLVLYLIRSVSAENSLNCISRFRFKCSLNYQRINMTLIESIYDSWLWSH